MRGTLNALKRLVLIFCLIFFAGGIWAQADEFVFENACVTLKNADVKLLQEGKIKFMQEKYAEALQLFEEIPVKDQIYLNYLKGICYSHDADNLQKAMELLLPLAPKADEVNGYYFNLAYAQVKNDSILPAIENYKKALEKETSKHLKNKSLINEINLSIMHCNAILNLKQKKNFVKITNIGLPVNTRAQEYCPLIPSNETIMIFTYRGPKSKGGNQKIKGNKILNEENIELFFEDIFVTGKVNDTLWSVPQGLENLNTNSHDAAVSLNADATELFVYRNKGAGNGDLYLSAKEGNSWSKPVAQLKLNSPEWDGSACFIPNSDLIIFASERKGGYGGKDLYYAERIKENMWGNITNLGGEINSKFDEDAPFVTADGRTLLFSSNNKSSIGGYDIFRCDMLNKEWQRPYNLGPPINTTNDDNYFTVRADGKVGYYSSYKKGGDGGQDIYKVEPGLPGRPVTLLQVEGFVTIDGKPTGAEVEIHSALNNKDLRFKIFSNASTGIFLSNLPGGDEYELTINVEKFPPRMITLNTLNIDSFVVLNVFAEFNSPVYDSTLVGNLTVTEQEIIKTEWDFDKNGFTRKFGDQKLEGLKYRVQVGAFKFAGNFNYNGIIGMPKIERHVYQDNVNRFTMGEFDTYDEAQLLLKIVQKNKIKDAFITAEYKGERKLLYQLVEEKLLR